MTVKVKQIKAVAKKFELLAVDFLLVNGCHSNNYRKCAKVKLSFSNGDEFVVTKREFESFRDFKFTLAEKHKTNH